jgi:hypothetical protein
LKLFVNAAAGASICRVLLPDPAGQVTYPANPPGQISVPPLLVHELATPTRPGPAETISEPAAGNGLPIVTAFGEPHGLPASTRFPALSNCAQSPALTAPPPNSRFDPRGVQVFALVHPYRFFPAGAAASKYAAPTAHVAGSVVPVWKGLVELAAEKSILLLCVLKSTKV